MDTLELGKVPVPNPCAITSLPIRQAGLPDLRQHPCSRRKCKHCNDIGASLDFA